MSPRFVHLRAEISALTDRRGYDNRKPTEIVADMKNLPADQQISLLQELVEKLEKL